MSNVISINSNNNLKFIVDVLKLQEIDMDTGEVLTEQRILIKLKNTQTGYSRIHPYTEFLNKWLNKSNKYKLNIARCLVKFLNFIYFDISKNVLPDITELTFELGIEFLNQCGKKCSRNTVAHYERVLTNFYFFLAEKKILKHINKSDFKYIESGYKVTLQSPFEGKFKQGKDKKQNKLHNLDFELIYPFIELALKEEPSIALGVYFQIFGGLRVSEVASIEYSNISVKGANGVNGMIINLATKDLRPDAKTGFIAGVKSNRKQRVNSSKGLLAEIYVLHRKKYKKDYTNAVFINTNGLPMTAENYRYRFNKLKEKFIKQLEQSNNIEYQAYAVTLRSFDWSTHLGRGIFSNMSAQVAENATELAVSRGDKNVNSSIAYIFDSDKMDDALTTLMNKFYNNPEEFK